MYVVMVFLLLIDSWPSFGDRVALQGYPNFQSSHFVSIILFEQLNHFYFVVEPNNTLEEVNTLSS
jgi:hypothetical protein